MLAKVSLLVYCSYVRTINDKLLSATKEDYIRAIYMLQEGGSSVGVTQIADKLKLGKSTVSERLKELAKEGYVEAGLYTHVSLTKKGYEVGRKLTYKHRIIEVFLNTVLKVPKGRVHEEAHRLEHACSDDVIKRLAKFLDYPENDPHGSKIPKIKGWN